MNGDGLAEHNNVVARLRRHQKKGLKAIFLILGFLLGLVVFFGVCTVKQPLNDQAALDRMNSMYARAIQAGVVESYAIERVLHRVDNDGDTQIVYWLDTILSDGQRVQKFHVEIVRPDGSLY